MPATTFNSQFEELLRKRVEAERQRVMAVIEGGEACKTLDAYRENVGYLRALRDIGDWCSDVETDLQER